MKDQEIIPFLHQLRRPTFFSRDDDFFERKLCHPDYCLVFLDVKKDEVAFFIRRFLRHQEFNTKAKRVGKVIRISHVGINIWQLHAEKEIHLSW